MIRTYLQSAKREDTMMIIGIEMSVRRVLVLEVDAEDQTLEMDTKGGQILEIDIGGQTLETGIEDQTLEIGIEDQDPETVTEEIVTENKYALILLGYL